jgi:hypothetical protein
LPTRQTAPGTADDAEGITLPTFSSAGRQSEKREKWATAGAHVTQPGTTGGGQQTHGAGETKH